jgi:hypothetical protein
VLGEAHEALAAVAEVMRQRPGSYLLVTTQLGKNGIYVTMKM